MARHRHCLPLQQGRILLAESGVTLLNDVSQTAENYLNDGYTVMYVAINGEISGLLTLSDTLRPSASDTIWQIQEIGVDPVLLTGDHDSAARHIAGQLGIREVHSGCLPEDKLKDIDHYQNAGQPVCMIGDGINDAPALKKAYVGIAMGGVDSDIA